MKKVILTLLCLLTAGVSFGQARSHQRYVVDEVVNYNDLKIGYTRHFYNFEDPYANSWKLGNTLTLEYDRYLWRGLQMGVYGGARFYGVHNLENGYYTPVREGIALLYGLNVNYHFKGLFNDDITSWDAWVGGRVGGYTAHVTSLEYGGLAGGSYYFEPQFGIFVEAMYGKAFLYEYEQTANDMHFQIRTGLSFQF